MIKKQLRMLRKISKNSKNRDKLYAKEELEEDKDMVHSLRSGLRYGLLGLAVVLCGFLSGCGKEGMSDNSGILRAGSAGIETASREVRLEIEQKAEEERKAAEEARQAEEAENVRQISKEHYFFSVIREVVERHYEIGTLSEVYQIFGGYINTTFGIYTMKEGERQTWLFRMYKRGKNLYALLY